MYRKEAKANTYTLSRTLHQRARVQEVQNILKITSFEFYLSFSYYQKKTSALVKLTTAI